MSIGPRDIGGFARSPRKPRLRFRKTATENTWSKYEVFCEDYSVDSRDRLLRHVEPPAFTRGLSSIPASTVRAWRADPAVINLRRRSGSVRRSVLHRVDEVVRLFEPFQLFGKGQPGQTSPLSPLVALPAAFPTRFVIPTTHRIRRVVVPSVDGCPQDPGGAQPRLSSTTGRHRRQT